MTKERTKNKEADTCMYICIYIYMHTYILKIHTRKGTRKQQRNKRHWNEIKQKPLSTCRRRSEWWVRPRRSRRARRLSVYTLLQVFFHSLTYHWTLRDSERNEWHWQNESREISSMIITSTSRALVPFLSPPGCKLVVAREAPYVCNGIRSPDRESNP